MKLLPLETYKSKPSSNREVVSFKTGTQADEEGFEFDKNPFLPLPPKLSALDLQV